MLQTPSFYTHFSLKNIVFLSLLRNIACCRHDNFLLHSFLLLKINFLKYLYFYYYVIMAELHIIGQIESGKNFPDNSLCCRWALQIGKFLKMHNFKSGNKI